MLLQLLFEYEKKDNEGRHTYVLQIATIITKMRLAIALIAKKCTCMH
jgi:hypothetical protein